MDLIGICQSLIVCCQRFEGDNFIVFLIFKNGFLTLSERTHSIAIFFLF